MKGIVTNCAIGLLVFVVIVAGIDPPKGPDRVTGNVATEAGNAPKTKDETAKLKRDSGHLTDDDDDKLSINKDGPPQIESVPTLSFQSHDYYIFKIPFFNYRKIPQLD